MFHKRSRFWLIGLVLAVILGGSCFSTTAVQLEEFKIPIVITGGIPKDWKLETYAARQFAVHFQRGDRIVLSGKADGTEEIEIHPGLEIRIIHPNGTIAGRVIPGGTWDPEIDLDKLDLTSMFAVGKNEVFITLYRSLPDLEPKHELTFDPMPPVEAGEEVEVTAEVRNNGFSPAESFFTSFSYCPPGGGECTEFDKVLTRRLDGGESILVAGEFDTSDLEGEYRICVEVDYDNYVEELDEENNKYCTSLLFEIKESVEGEAASLPVELWANASTLAKGQLTKPMIAPVAIGNQAPPRYVSSSSLWLVRFTDSSASRLAMMLTREVSQLQREAAVAWTSSSGRIIQRKLWRAYRYALWPRRSEMAQTLIDNAIELIRNIDCAKLIELVKGGLPELRGEIEVLFAQNEGIAEPANETLDEIAGLHKLLCRLNPGSLDCQDSEEIIPEPPVLKTCPQIKDELFNVIDLLFEARRRVPGHEAMQYIREAWNLLRAPLGDLEDDWGQVNERLSRLRNQTRLLQWALRRGNRYSLGAQDRGHLSFRLHPNPISSGLPVTVSAEGSSIESIELQVFALDGRLVLDKRAELNYLQFSPLDDQGRPLANGVYLYVITVRGWDGEVLRSEVRKLVILR